MYVARIDLHCRSNQFKTANTTHRPVRFGMGDVYKEIHDLLVPGVIPKGAGHGFKCKPVKRRYAFDAEEVPRVRKGLWMGGECADGR